MQSVVVVGGGLAGMVSALHLARHGRKVTLLEASAALGGKTGATFEDGRAIEHGYHVFPKWYPNVRALLKELAVELVDFDRYHYILPGGFPDKVTVQAVTGLRPLMHNMLNGLMPWYHEVLFFNFTLDLMSRRRQDKRSLDRVSTLGLMQQAWYMTERIAELQHENVLKASAIPTYEMSAMTAKKIGAFWARQADPLLSVLPGDMQTTFIEPLARELTRAGVDVRFEQEVIGLTVEGGIIRAAEVRGGPDVRADAFIVATPFDVARRWVDGHLYLLDPSLGNMHQLDGKPMAALHVRLTRRLPGLPREHVFFHGGVYGLSFIDVSQTWPDVPTTQLSFIASNYAPLDALDEEAATSALLAEVREFLPLRSEDIEWTKLHANVDEPLFINTIGAWPNRPTPVTRVPNLFLAGDYVRNAIDLACMEGAVSSAIAAVAALLRAAGEAEPPVPATPPRHSRPLLLAARAALLPSVVAAYAVARVTETFAAEEPRQTSVRRRSIPPPRG